MRILLTLPDLHFGGTSNLLLQNVEKLTLNNEVFIIYFGANSTMLESFKKKGVNIKRINYTGPKSIFSTISKLRSFIKTNKIDVIHTNLFLDKFLIAISTPGFSGVKISTIHAADIKRYQGSLKGNLLLKLDNFLHNNIYFKTIVVSEASRNFCIEKRGIKKKKLKLILNGVAPLKVQKIDSPIFPQDNIIFGTACRFQKIKGLDRLILLVKFLKEQGLNIKLLLIGDGPLKNELETQIRDLNLTQDIKITGFTDNVEYYLNQIHYYVNSSYSEAMPLSVLEAMSLGKPVIASDVGGLKEIVNNNSNGLRINFDAIEDEIERVKAFLSRNSSKYDEYSENARETYLSKFSTKVYIEKLLNFYSEALKKDN